MLLLFREEQHRCLKSELSTPAMRAGAALFFVAAVASGILVFTPSSLQIAMGITEVAAANRGTIACSLALSVAS